MQPKEIIVDSREKRPLWDLCTVQALKTGDYSLVGFEDKIAIERKSCGDLFKSLGSDSKRFRKELTRAKELDYFALVIEGTPYNILLKDFEGGDYIDKMKGETVFKILMTLSVKYNFPIFFSRSREEARLIILGLFESFLHLQK